MSIDNETLPPSPPPTASAASADERTWAIAAHLSAFSAFVTGIGCVAGPLVVWLIKRDTLPFVADQAKEALNFNLTLLIACACLWLFSLITLGLGLIITIPLLVIIFVGWVILTIVAAVNANNGVHYRYPLTLRLIK